MELLPSIPYVKPSITQIELDMVAEAMTLGWGEGAYKYIGDFEEEFAKFIGSDFAVATSSCTGALELGLAALNLEKNDEVILADSNWVATLSPIVRLGLKPVFVDVDLETWTIAPESIVAAITPKTRVVVATHLYGNCADLTGIQDICDKNDLFLIEDAAESIGTKFQEKSTGTFGHFGVFSFHGSKTLTTGEGGMLVTNSLEFANRVRELNNHGRKIGETKQFWASEIGYKFRMTNMQAALGLAQLTRIDELLSRKREILEFYRHNLATPYGLGINPIQTNVISGAWMPNIVIPEKYGIDRDVLVNQFRLANIDARVFFWPLTDLPFIQLPAENPNSHFLSEHSINLPSFHDISKAELDRVCDLVSTLIESQI